MKEDLQSHEAKIKSHTPIWIALSEFYLDKELDDKDLLRIATIFSESEFSLKQIKEIDLFEVFPTLQSNINTVAGNWTGFDEKELVKSCSETLEKRNNWMFESIVRFRNFFVFWMRRHYWEKVESMYKSLQL